jgi:single-strand DNA-binding protein
MSGVNKVILIGRLGKDPEVRNLDGGVKVATFTLATTETFKDKNGVRQEQTEWHNVVLWRGLAEISEKYLNKGSQVYLEGKIKTRSYEKDGTKKYMTEILVDNMTMLGGKRDNDTSPHTASTPDDIPSEVNEPTDDLPF